MQGFSQALEEDRVDLWRQRLLESARARRLLADNLLPDRQLGLTFKRFAARQHEISDHSQAELIRFPVDFVFVSNLFGRHVVGRSHRALGDTVARQALGDPEVGDANVAGGIQQYIVRLNVPMD